MGTTVRTVNGVNKLDRDDYGFLFKNRRKVKQEQPDCVGEVKVDGVWYWISGWTRTGKREDEHGVKEKYLSVAFTRKELQQGRVDRDLLPKKEHNGT
jgi:hypothetical protein